MLSLLLMFNTVYSVGPLERQRDKDCRMYTCAWATGVFILIGMGVGLTCLSDSQCFSRKPGSNDTSINGSATNFSRNESGGYTVQSSPASLTPASVPTETRTSPRGKSGG